MPPTNHNPMRRDSRRQLLLGAIQSDLRSIDGAMAKAIRLTEEVQGSDGAGGLADVMLLVKMRLELIKVVMPKAAANVLIGIIPPMDDEDRQRIRELVDLKIAMISGESTPHEDHTDAEDDHHD